MKVKLLLFTVMATFAITVNAQNTNLGKKNPIEGLWVFRGQRVNGEVSLQKNLNTFKLISTDNSLLNFVASPEKPFITLKGHVEVLSDSVFVEHIEKALNSSLNGKASELQYKIEEDRLLYVKFFIEKNSLNQPINLWFEEIWERVEMIEVRQTTSDNVI